MSEVCLKEERGLHRMMKVNYIAALDIPEAWWLCMREVLEGGYVYSNDRGSFVGERRKEFDLAVVQIKYPGRRPLIPDVPQGCPPPTSQEYVDNYLAYLMTDAKKPDEEYTYGWYLEAQIEKVIAMLKASPNTNQAYMTVGAPDTVNMDDPPCLRGIQCRVRYGALHFIVYFRSWDLYGGFPSNLAALQMMKEHMASEIGVPDGEMECISGGLHLYEHTWEYAKMVLKQKE